MGGKRSTKLTPTLYTKKETLMVVNTYVKMHGLQDASSAMSVLLDAPLCDALFRGTIAKGERYPTSTTKKDMCIRFVQRCRTWHVLRKANGDVVAGTGAGTPIEVDVVAIKGRKKFLTCVRNTEALGLSTSTLLHEFMKKFAARCVCVRC